MSTSANSGCGDVDAAFDGPGDVVEELRGAEDDRPHQPTLLEDQLPVATRAIRADDDGPRLARRSVDNADREQIDSRHLQPRRLRRDTVDRLTSDHVRGCDLRLLHAGRPEPIAAAVVIDNVADSEDVRVGRVHAVVDADPAGHVETRRLCQLGVGHDPGRDQTQLSIDRASLDELDSGNPHVGEDALRLSPRQHLDSQVLEHLPQQRSRLLVQLPAQRPWPAVENEHPEHQVARGSTRIRARADPRRR